MPALLWNMMMSMSGSWFFVVVSEAINVGHTNIILPGIGGYVALAIEQGNLRAIGWAILTMLLVILAYDQLIFRPLVVWGDRFRIDQEQGTQVPTSWALTMLQRSRIMGAFHALFYAVVRWTSRKTPRPQALIRIANAGASRRADLLWFLLLVTVVVWALWRIAHMLIGETSLHEALQVAGLATLTLARVMILIALASLLWVPIGIWVGLRPRATQIVQPIAQFLAAFPANLLFPIVTYFIVMWTLNPDIWLSPLMILGTQWYILFNVIAGASAIPTDLIEVCDVFRMSRVERWRRLFLPGIFPYLVTGFVTASGGAWNASIVAEYSKIQGKTYSTVGLGAVISRATDAGNFAVLLGATVVMAATVVTVNRLFWRKMYGLASTRYKLEG
jgi:NitT/TauT family transport system permease protein